VPHVAALLAPAASDLARVKPVKIEQIGRVPDRVMELLLPSRDR
jgi:hypothetical protein